MTTAPRPIEPTRPRAPQPAHRPPTGQAPTRDADAHDNPPTIELETKRGNGERNFRWTLILVLVALLCGGAVFVSQIHQPLAAERERLATELDGATRVRDEATAALAALTTERDALRTERDAITAERDALRSREQELAGAVAERDARIGALQAMHDQLTEQLRSEIAAGDVTVSQGEGRVAVRLADQILFAPGRAELSDRGQALLRRVATSLARMEDRLIQVEGHTDSTPLTGDALERFATNWELSTARATNVVRFLSDQCSIPGERLAAAGYSEFRPVGDNGTVRGRRMNRRIELTLIARPRA
ncbi:OmpA/MotB family protein [Sandaracinus amylolyticus]|uniref:OmpA/MotB family protein n=1 Tax=Sandaracinus amylolyticus TaxID=927083 RepID=UPI001F18ACBC|nr:OmpA family protein [Sandaracinus amylolyticus]UJR85557.1 Hypothetical protein I5071_76370 [Sandaracinus amylolyticus]